MTRLRQRLAHLEQAACQIAQEEAPLPSLSTQDDSGVLAGELAAAFGTIAKNYRDVLGLSPEEARARASKSNSAFEELVLRGPPDQVQWFGLATLAERDPELALRRWEEVKEAAREELETGHRAARAVECNLPDCWQRAQFLAIRLDLAQAWRPRNGLEWQLIDMLAQAHTVLLWWQQILAARSLSAAMHCKRAMAGAGFCEPPRLTEAEAVEEAAAMVERCHRLFLKTLEALQKQRRLAPAVIVQNAGQVNVGGQQVNMAGPLVTGGSA
jgi:hypothetical protein